MRFALIGSALFGALGALIAGVIMYVVDAPHWTVYVWPTWFWLMGTDKQAPDFIFAATLGILSNACVYALVGAVIFGLGVLIRASFNGRDDEGDD